MYSFPNHIDTDRGAAYDAGALWAFETERYTVAFFALDEDVDPADSFQFKKDVEYARSGDPAHWFMATVAVYDEHGELIGQARAIGCSSGSFREFYSAHRWQYSRKQRRYIEDPKSREWKAIEARRPRRRDGSRADSHYFLEMVRYAVREARLHVALASDGARRA